MRCCVRVPDYQRPLRSPAARRRQGLRRHRSQEARHHPSGAAEQAARHPSALPERVKCWGGTLRFDYESTGEETYFRDNADPDARSHRVFAVHQPATLHAWLKEEDTYRASLRQMPPLDVSGLRDCQIDAVQGLEKSLAQDKPRSLIQMATGTGKTYTAFQIIWCLWKGRPEETHSVPRRPQRAGRSDHGGAYAKTSQGASVSLVQSSGRRNGQVRCLRNPR